MKYLKIFFINFILIILGSYLLNFLLINYYNLNSPHIEIKGNDSFSQNERLVKFRENQINKKEIIKIPDKFKNNFDYNEVLYETDSHGYIKPSDIYSKPDFNFFFLGGSTTENLYTQHEKRFPYLIAKKLKNKLGLKINSFNAARSKNNSLHSLNLLINKIINLKPDVVFLHHAINDQHIFLFGDNFYWNNNNDRQILINPNTKVSLNKKITIYLKNNFSGIYALYSIIKYNYSKDKKLLVNKNEVNNKNKLINSENIEQFLKINKIFISLSNTYNFKLIYIIQASNFKQNDYRKETQRKYIKVLKGFLNKQSLDKKNNLYYIDLSSRLDNNSKYFYDEMHFNVLGNETVSDIISEEIIKKKILAIKN
jgi:hypothetical protein